MDKKTRRGPLLFITQRFSTIPVVNMQEIYTNKQEIQQQIEEKYVVGEVKKGPGVSALKADLDPNKLELEQNTPAHKTHERQRFNRLKSFKEMNVSERLEYLINFPKALPPVSCVFFTEEKNFQGYLVEYREQEITVQHQDQTTETLPVNKITDILMIGIKR